MADTVTSQTILDTPYRLVMKFTKVMVQERCSSESRCSAFTAGEKVQHAGVSIDRIYL